MNVDKRNKNHNFFYILPIYRNIIERNKKKIIYWSCFRHKNDESTTGERRENVRELSEAIVYRGCC